MFFASLAFQLIRFAPGIIYLHLICYIMMWIHYYVAKHVAKLKQNIKIKKKKLNEAKQLTHPSNVKDSITFSSMFVAYLCRTSMLFNFCKKYHKYFFRPTGAYPSDFYRIWWNWVLSFYLKVFSCNPLNLVIPTRYLTKLKK